MTPPDRAAAHVAWRRAEPLPLPPLPPLPCLSGLLDDRLRLDFRASGAGEPPCLPGELSRLPGELSRLPGEALPARWPSPREGDDLRSGVGSGPAPAAPLSAGAPEAAAPSPRPCDGERDLVLSLELERDRERVLDGDLLSIGGASRPYPPS